MDGNLKDHNVLQFAQRIQVIRQRVKDKSKQVQKRYKEQHDKHHVDHRSQVRYDMVVFG